MNPEENMAAKISYRIHKIMEGMGWILGLVGIAFAQTGNLINHSEGHSVCTLALEILNAHNAVRAELNLSSLQWSDELAALSQKWADTLLAQNRFVHSPNSSYGENLFMITGGSASPAAVVWQWASESRNYDYNSNTCNGICGHYTQLVWRRTSRVGCAVARGHGREVWVCNYDPPGNVLGQLPY